jgi:hypothetical protein
VHVVFAVSLTRERARELTQVRRASSQAALSPTVHGTLSG